jgi:LuxR family transcriptional regulator, maltose regulon positive regulatory protein
MTRSGSPTSSPLHLVVPTGGARSPVGDEESPFGCELAPRRHLEELFETILRRVVTVLEAPMGYGKTAALWQWYRQARSQGLPAALLKLHEIGADPAAFLRRLHEALLALGFMPECSADLPADAESFLAMWLALQRPCLILLDDYPLEGAAELDATFTALLRKPPPGMRFVVATRAPVGWPLYDLLIRGHALRIEQGQLRFTPEEVQSYLKLGEAREEDRQAVEDLLRGWPVALHILDLSRERSQMNIADLVRHPPQLALGYVREQMLRELPQEVADFLLAIAILERVSAPLADALREANDSHRLLRLAVQHGVPITLDGAEPGWHELHPFLRACLRVESLTLDEVRVRQLNLRALDWLAARGRLEEAARHARLAGDARRLAGLIEQAGAIHVAIRIGMPTLARLLEQMPVDWVHEFPRIDVARALLIVSMGQFQDARRVLESVKAARRLPGAAVDAVLDRDVWLAEVYLNTHEDRPLPAQLEQTEFAQVLASTPTTDPGVKAFLNFFLRFRVHLRRGELGAAHDALTEAEFWYREAGAAYPVLFLNMLLALVSLYQGRLHASREFYGRAEAIATGRFATEAQGQIVSGLLGATVCYELNDLDTASRLLARNMPQIEETQCWADGYIVSHLMASFMEFHNRGLEAALEIVARGVALAERRPFPRVLRAMKLQRAELLARSGSGDEALAQLAELGIQRRQDCLVWADDATWLERNLAGLALARTCLLRSDYVTVLEITEAFAAECQSVGGMHFLLRLRLLQALAWRAVGKRDDSTSALQAAFAISVPEDASRAFLDEGEPMLDLLKDFMRESGVRQLPPQTVAFITTLLTAFAGDRAPEDPPAGMSILSPREYHVLVALARGQSNKVIARQLDLTENTVKFHLRSIYEKLGVSSRGMASAVAHEMGLLPPPEGGG